jgi:hypothetical protein
MLGVQGLSLDQHFAILAPYPTLPYTSVAACGDQSVAGDSGRVKWCGFVFVKSYMGWRDVREATSHSWLLDR